MLFAIDLEGVLAPEIWPILGGHFGIAELTLTTRDTGDLDALMAARLGSLARRGLKLADLQAVAHAIEPCPGAREFLGRLREIGEVILISDTFHELAEPLAQRLGGHSLFANRFDLAPDGSLRGTTLRIRGRKERIVSGFTLAGFRVGAMGDSLNDRTILESCDFPVLYRPAEALRAALPEAAVAQTLDEALAHFEAAQRRLEASGP